MNVVVVALGKIGLPLAAQIARAGHRVVGCDINAARPSSERMSADMPKIAATTTANLRRDTVPVTVLSNSWSDATGRAASKLWSTRPSVVAVIAPSVRTTRFATVGGR